MLTYPAVSRKEKDLERVQQIAQDVGYAGFDLEYDPQTKKPGLTSLAAGYQETLEDGLCVSVEWRFLREVAYRLLDQGVKLVGHATVTADKPVLDRCRRRASQLSAWHDTMILHYLANADLCKAPKGGKESDTPMSQGPGFMNIWAMASLYVEIPNWKVCRGSRCKGPCRDCDPAGYNGVDSIVPCHALPRLQADLRKKQIPSTLVDHYKALGALCLRMEEHGTKIDVPYLTELAATMEERKRDHFVSKLVPRRGKKGQELTTKVREWNSPFSPRSPQAITQYFDKRGVYLKGTDRASLIQAHRKLTSRKKHDETAAHWLSKLIDYKGEGKGLSSWFDPKYVDEDNLSHARFIHVGSSLGRLSSSSPNHQNIPVRGFGSAVRRGIIARDESLELAVADSAQLELRQCLYAAGVEVDEDDAFLWLVKQADGLFEKVAEETSSVYLQKPRNAAKRLAHAADYLEGLQLISPSELAGSAALRQNRHQGTLIVHEDWMFEERYVAFNGINLAADLWGSATRENRKNALRLQNAYFTKFPALRQWQRKVTQYVEEHGCMRSATGWYLRLHGDDADKLKVAVATIGQGQSAHYIQETMLRSYASTKRVPLLQVHDEVVHEVPRSWSNGQVLELFEPMASESGMLPGFKAPVKVYRGPNWLDTKYIGTLR